MFFHEWNEQKKPQFNFSISSQNLSIIECNFFKWDAKVTKIWHLLFHRIWKKKLTNQLNHIYPWLILQLNHSQKCLVTLQLQTCQCVVCRFDGIFLIFLLIVVSIWVCPQRNMSGSGLQLIHCCNFTKFLMFKNFVKLQLELYFEIFVKLIQIAISRNFSFTWTASASAQFVDCSAQLE